VIGRGRFFDAIMLLVSVGFSFTGKNKTTFDTVAMVPSLGTHLLFYQFLWKELLHYLPDHS